jgi:hypothetical protein
MSRELSVRARWARACRSEWKAAGIAEGEVSDRDFAAAPIFFLLRRSARLPSATSICRAFWKSLRHNKATPWQASP